MSLRKNTPWRFRSFVWMWICRALEGERRDGVQLVLVEDPSVSLGGTQITMAGKFADVLWVGALSD